MRTRLLALLLAVGLAASACSDSDDSGDASSETAGFASATTTIPAMAGDEAEATFGESGDRGDFETAVSEDVVANGLGDGGAVTPVAQTAQPINAGRDIVRTAFIETEVEDLGEATQRVATAIEGLGGLLFGQQTTTTGTPRTTMTFKVQPADFTVAIARITDVGFVRDQHITADDVTERVVDLESRIASAATSVERLREFLADATNLEAIAQVEQQLLERETNLEVLRGQLRTVQNQVALATITITMVEIEPGPAIELATAVYAGHDGGVTCGGEDQVEVDEGDPITLCFAVTNAGDTHVGSVDVRDERFDLDPDDFLVARGSAEGPIGPGEQVVFYAETVAEQDSLGLGQATAIAVDIDGNDLRLPGLGARSEHRVDVIEDDSLPGFTSGLAAGWSLLTQLVGALVLAAGFLLPFLWAVVLGYFVVRWLRRRRPEGPVPPPPAAPQPSQA